MFPYLPNIDHVREGSFLLLTITLLLVYSHLLRLRQRRLDSQILYQQDLVLSGAEIAHQALEPITRDVFAAYIISKVTQCLSVRGVHFYRAEPDGTVTSYLDHPLSASIHRPDHPPLSLDQLQLNEPSLQRMFTERIPLFKQGIWDDRHPLDGPVSSICLPIFGFYDPIVFEVYDQRGRYFSSEEIEYLRGIVTTIGLFLRRSAQEYLYRALAEGGTDIVTFLDEAGAVIWTSPSAERLLGYTPAELNVGGQHPWPTITEPNDLLRTSNWRIQGMTNERLRITHQNGTIIPLDVTIVPLIYNDEFIGYRGLSSDATDKEQMEELKTHIVTMIAHELRTPVTVISGYSALAARTKDNEQMRIYVRQIGEEITELNQIINGLLEIDSARLGRLTKQTTQLDLCEVVSDQVYRFSLAHPEHSGRFDLFFPPGPVIGLWDKTKLGELVINLIDNAIKYSTKTVVMTVTADPIAASLSVCDQGYGISAEEMTAIFTPYYQAGRLTGVTTQGLGLGLTLIKAIVELHEGTIAVDSEIGVGSTFTVRLPLN